MPPLKSRLLLASAAVALTSVLFIDFCNLMYGCGCRSLWAGADALCNIHHQGVRHCPWCTIGLAGGGAVWLAIVGTQSLLALRTPGGWIQRSMLTLGAFPLVGGVLAVAIGMAQGYWDK